MIFLRLKYFLLSLLITLLVELTFFFLFGKRSLKDALLLVLVNFMTNPTMQLSYWLLVSQTDWSPWWTKLIIECLVVFWEGWLYLVHGKSFRKPFYFSAGANALSFSIGELLFLSSGALILPLV